MLKQNKNYYDILGVTPDVELPELKTVYRRLVRKFHPDINPDGELRFKDITEAYEVLSDEKLRKNYDTINGFFKSAKARGASSTFQETYRKSYQKTEDVKNQDEKFKDENLKKTNASSNAQSASQKKSKTDFSENKKEEKPFSEKINEFIDGFSQVKKTKKATPKPENGGDIYVDVSVTLRESIRGTHKIVNVVHTKVCEHCRGRKFINDAKCPVCDGLGELTEHQKIDVTIPANVKNGAKLRLSGEGKKGVNGGKNGDLYLKIAVISDSLFKIDGNDLLCEVPISPFEAVLGGDIIVPSLDDSITLSLPKNTKSGQVFRISSKGLKKNNLVGDIIITVRIQIPDKISNQEIALYKELRNLSGESLRKNLIND